MASTLPPVKGTAFTFDIALVSQASPYIFKTSPTLAAGDITVSLDGGSFSNIATLPTQIGTTGVLPVALSADEMNADRVVVRFHDVAGDEWQDALVTIYTAAQTLDAMQANIGAGGAGLTGIGDTRLANLDAAVSSRSTLTAADVWGYATRTLTSLSALLSSIAAAIWAYASRTLTQPAASVLAAVTGSTLNVVKSRTYDATLSGLTLQATWTGVKFTAKTDAREPDSASLLQVTVSNPAAPTTDGALYVQGAVATAAQRLQGSLVVDQAAGTVTLHLQDDLTALLALLGGARYDITQYYTDGGETKSTQLTRGVWTVSATETGALA